VIPVAYGGGSFGFGYDALSRRTSLTRPNTVNTSYGYDNLSHLLSVVHQKRTSTLDGASYTVDNTGSRQSRTALPGTTATNFTYDAIYELLTAKQGATTKESYTYDPVGNRLSNLAGSGWSNNASNELTSRLGFTYTYDNNGNMLTSVSGTNTTHYTWDFENRLTSVQLPGSGGSVTFKYDPFGRRIYKSSSTATSIYAYDLRNTVEEVNASGGVVARYAHGIHIDEPLAMLRGTTTDFYEADGLGSVTSLTSSSGANAGTYTYDSFGNLTASTGSLTNSFRYTAREFDTETSLYFYRARYYDASAGRFASEDPIRFRGGMNFYAYVKNRPTLMRDPSGRACWGGGITGSAAASAFWFGVGFEDSFYAVGDTLGNQGILDCSGGGIGAMSGVGGSVGVQGSSIISPNCGSICDLEGGFGGATGFAGAGLTGLVSGGVSLGNTAATFTGGGGLGVGAGAGLVGIGGNCTLILKHHKCPSCPSPKH
jgi:RHS repeat-associated protein